MRYAVIVLGLCVLAAGCDTVTGPRDEPPPIPGAVRFQPTENHETWYHDTESCIGLEGDFGAVRWWWAEELPGSPSVAGLFIAPHDIVLRRDRWETGTFVKHESAHHILHYNNVHSHHNHEHPAFLDCGLY